MPTFIEERTYYPDGCEPDDYDAFAFQVNVAYRGNGKWAVMRGNSRMAQQLTHTGRWICAPLKMTAMRWCRFDFDAACRLAEVHVNDVVVNGGTWAQWEARRATH